MNFQPVDNVRVLAIANKIYIKEKNHALVIDFGIHPKLYFFSIIFYLFIGRLKFYPKTLELSA